MLCIDTFAINFFRVSLRNKEFWLLSCQGNCRCLEPQEQGPNLNAKIKENMVTDQQIEAKIRHEIAMKVDITTKVFLMLAAIGLFLNVADKLILG